MDVHLHCIASDSGSMPADIEKKLLVIILFLIEGACGKCINIAVQHELTFSIFLRCLIVAWEKVQ